MVGTIADDAADKNNCVLYLAPAATTFCSGNVVRVTTSNFKSAAPTEAASLSRALISRFITSAWSWLIVARPAPAEVPNPKFNEVNEGSVGKSSW